MGLGILELQRKTVSWFKRNRYIPVLETKIYSTEEIVIGSYFGKPLYRKCIQSNYATGNSGDNVITRNSVGLTDCYIVSISGVDEFGVTLKPYSAATGMIEQSVFLADNDEIWIRHGNRPRNSGKAVTIFVEYTKNGDTTDTTTPFEPLTEYSYEERMIGYWVDGSPLYRKVYDITPNMTSVNNSWLKLVTDTDTLSNVKLISGRILGPNREQKPLDIKIENGSIYEWTATGGDPISMCIVEYIKNQT